MRAVSSDFRSSLEKPLELEIRCPVETQVLPVVRTLVTALASHMGFREEDTERIEMATDEACANVIRHAYKHLGVSPDLPETKRTPDNEVTPECGLWLRLYIDQTMLRICVIDRGIGIKDQPRGHLSVEEFTEKGGDGGLGVYIIQNFMDEVEFDCPPESGTVLTMIKYLRVPE